VLRSFIIASGTCVPANSSYTAKYGRTHCEPPTEIPQIALLKSHKKKLFTRNSVNDAMLSSGFQNTACKLKASTLVYRSNPNENEDEVLTL
jgi:hypothetical protein